MVILHYALGFPPYRSGGLTKYCMDIMKEQVRQGNEVGLLWPGSVRMVGHKTYIRTGKPEYGIKSYELVNPLPVPLDEGITDIKAYTAPADKKIYIDFLKKTAPQAIHVHTLMGIHREFFEAANELDIPIVFTTHDYFGLCAKVNFFTNGHICDGSCEKCVECNKNALSLKKILIMQSSLYRILKDSAPVKKIRSAHRQKFYDESLNDIHSNDSQAQQTAGSESGLLTAADYIKLRNYYIDMINMVDRIHYNSTVTKEVYERFITPKDSVVMNIMHADIADHRKQKTFSEDKLRITYLAPPKPYKGYNVLVKALDELWNENRHDFELRMYQQAARLAPYMRIREGGYRYGELESIFDNTDVLIVPSVWYETFGFTVIEALSYGVPVIVSDRVGARDIIGDGGIVVKADSVTELKKAIAQLNADKLTKMNRSIINNYKLDSYEEYVKKNNRLYLSLR